MSAVSILRANDPALIDALFETQSVKQCRHAEPCSPGGKPLACATHQQWHSHRPHQFLGAITCESCRHMGGVSWPDPFGDKHYCHKADERRAAGFRSTGDFAEDFMQEFRKFYDASPRQWAEGCAFFEPRDLAERANGGAK